MNYFLEQPYFHSLRPHICTLPALCWPQRHLCMHLRLQPSRIFQSIYKCRSSNSSPPEAFRKVDKRMERKASCHKALCSGIFPGSHPRSTLTDRHVFPKHKSSHVTFFKNPSGVLFQLNLPSFQTWVSWSLLTWLLLPKKQNKTEQKQPPPQTCLAFKSLFLYLSFCGEFHDLSLTPLLVRQN